MMYDGFISCSSSPSAQRRVGLLVAVAEDKFGIRFKALDDKDEVLGDGIRASEFFLPILTKDYVSKVDGGLIEMKDGKIVESCRFEANMGIIHRGESRTIPLVMEPALKDKLKWGDIIGGNFGNLSYVACFSDGDVEKACEMVARQMDYAKKGKRVHAFGVFNSIDVKEMQVVAKWKAAEYVEGTRLWIHDFMEKAWLSKADWSQVFVLLGKSGFGKSVWMANICERGQLFDPVEVYESLSSNKSKETSPFKRLSCKFSNQLSRSAKVVVVVACHFFCRDDMKVRSGKACILSLASQMCETIPNFSEYLSLRNKSTDVKSLDAKELFKCLIVEPLTEMKGYGVSPSSSGGRAIVIVDALDECYDEDRKELFKIFQTLWRELVPSWLGVCISIQTDDFMVDSHSHQATILDMNDEPNLLQDMRVCLLKQKERPMKTVLQQSKGSLLHLRFTEGDLSSDPSASLNRLYEKHFKRLLELLGDEKYQILFSSMCFAREPLTIQVVEKLLDDENVLKDDDEIKKVVTLFGDSVRFVHNSIAEFLMDPNKCREEHLRVEEHIGRMELGKYCRENCLDSFYAAKHLVYYDPSAISDILRNFQKLHQIVVVIFGRGHIGSFVDDLNRFYQIDDATTKLVVRALEKSVKVLDEEPKALASQMLGRLAGSNVFQSMEEVDCVSYLKPVGRQACPGNANDPLRLTLNGHRNRVSEVVMNKDVVVSCSNDHTIKIWSRFTGECLRTLDGHTGPVNSVALSTNENELLVSGSSDMTIKIWSLRSGECLGTLEIHGKVFSIDIWGDKVVSKSDDIVVKVWSLASGECLQTLDTCDDDEFLYCLTVNEDTVACGSDVGLIRVWDLESGKCLKTLQGHTSSVRSVAISDGVLVSGSHDLSIKVWDLETCECLNTLHGHMEPVVSVIVCDEMIVTGSWDTMVKVWNRKSGQCLHTFTGHKICVHSVAMFDGMIVSGSFDNTVKLWNFGEPSSTKTEGNIGHVRSVAISHDIIVSGSDDETIKIWNLFDGKCLQTLHGHNNWVMSVAICEDLIVSGSLDNTVKIWSIDAESVYKPYKDIQTA